MDVHHRRPKDDRHTAANRVIVAADSADDGNRFRAGRARAHAPDRHAKPPAGGASNTGARAPDRHAQPPAGSPSDIGARAPDRLGQPPAGAASNTDARAPDRNDPNGRSARITRAAPNHRNDHNECVDSMSAGIGAVRLSGAEIERVILGLAARQHGAVERAQLVELGVPRRAVERRVAAGRLRRVHRGVYVVDALVDARTQEAAAVLACGTDAAVSHHSAAAMLSLLPPRRPVDPVDVSVSAGDRRHTGIRLHRPRRLEVSDVVTVDGVPVTTAARTLADIAASLSRTDLERACERALRTGLTTHEEVQAQLARCRRHGAGRLAAVLQSLLPGHTRSAAEDRLLELLRRGQLPRPDVNVVISGYEVDFLWPAHRIIVEVDGFAFHSSRSRFEADRRRDAVLAAEGFRVVRVTWRQLSDEPEAVVVRIGQMLVHRGPADEIAGPRAATASRSSGRLMRSPGHAPQLPVDPRAG